MPAAEHKNSTALCNAYFPVPLNCNVRRGLPL
jgi:hypothetical protein